MGEFDESRHPRDHGKFTSEGAHAVAAKARKGHEAKAKEHEAKASEHEQHAASAPAGDHATRGQHEAAANQHHEAAAAHEGHAGGLGAWVQHQQSGGHGKPEHGGAGVAEWVKSKVEHAGEAAKELGEKAGEAIERGAEGDPLKVGREAIEAGAGAAVHTAGKLIPGGGGKGEHGHH